MRKWVIRVSGNRCERWGLKVGVCVDGEKGSEGVSKGYKEI